jgi:hypothetical protein
LCPDPKEVQGFKTCADVSKAEAEGEVVVYATNPEAAELQVLGEFAKLFPKIKPNYTRLQAGALYAKVTAERQAKTYTVDAMQISDMGMILDFQKKNGYVRYPAIPSKPADAYAPAHHASTDCVDHAGDLVPRDAREGEVGPLPFDRETVAVAHTADLDADADLAPRWLGYVALDEFKGAASPRHLHRAHLCHRRLPVGAGCRARCRSTEDGVTGWGISTPGARLR